MSFIEKIKNFVHGAAVEVSTIFEELVGKDNAHRFAQAALAMLKSEAGVIVMDAVKAASTLSVDGAGKHQAAFDQIKQDLKAAEKSIPDSLLHLLIEAAVAALKGHILPA